MSLATDVDLDKIGPTCGAEELAWHLICYREPGHSRRHYGATADGSHEGYWGEGVTHVARSRRPALVHD